jgi:hypothetical protein
VIESWFVNRPIIPQALVVREEEEKAEDWSARSSAVNPNIKGTTIILIRDNNMVGWFLGYRLVRIEVSRR